MVSLTEAQETLEHEWKVRQMQSDIRLKDEQTRWEPWKAMSAAFTAGVIVAGALISGSLWIGAHFLH